MKMPEEILEDLLEESTRYAEGGKPEHINCASESFKNELKELEAYYSKKIHDTLLSEINAIIPYESDEIRETATMCKAKLLGKCTVISVIKRALGLVER